jgi:Leucine-rich repeat (LRR) protein
MGPQNIRNHYFKKVKANISGDNHHDLELSQDEEMSIDFKLSYDGYYDLYLASDEEDYNKQVIYSTSIIDSGDGDNLPVWVDINSSLSRDTTRTTTCTDQIIMSAIPLTILSKNVWGGARSTCSTASTTFTICDIMWTGMDNGLWDGRVSPGLPDCLTLNSNTPPSLNFDRFQYDKRLKLNQVKDLSYYAWPPPMVTTDTSILLNSDSSGYFYDLKGGFFQGFYKLYGYPYEVLPNRPNKGWSFETYLKIHSADTTSSYCYTVANSGDENYCASAASQTFNYNNSSYPPNNGGFFFYKGTRAEDKWGFSQFTNMDQSILSACTTITGQTDCCDVEDKEVLLLDQNMSPSPKYDTFSNAIGFRITEDMRIGYRTIRYTKQCVDTGEVLTGGTCATETTMQQESICGYIIEESYSEPICPYAMLSGTCADIWLQVDVVFERDLYIDECDLYNDGGVNDLIKVRHDKFYRYGQHFEDGDSWGSLCDCDDKQYPEFIDEAYFNYECKEPQVQKWFSERDFRMGTLKFYVNGRIVHTVNDYEEIIPRQLNTNKQTQVGVAYNMSWGGGSQGLRNMVVPSVTDCIDTQIYTYGTVNPLTTPIIWAPNTMSSPSERLISDNFGGSFVGGISQMMYYVKPLQADEIYHNFKINKDRYSLIDCEECEDCPKGCIDCELPTGTTQIQNYGLSTTYIPDGAFRAVLSSPPYSIVFDSNYRTETTSLESITSLNLWSNGITNLTGIESFSGLEELYCDDNQLTSLDLSGNPLLTELGCEMNQLTSLNLSGNPLLEELYCDGNQLTSLDLSSNPLLVYLWCLNNQLTSLDLTTNTALEGLDCSNNQLTSLDVRNGNNINMGYTYNGQNYTLFSTLGNPSLLTINVDDPSWATINWVQSVDIDPWTTFTEIYPVYVPDANFRAELIASYGVTFDTNNETPSTSVNTIIDLQLYQKNISDLTGISGFTALEILFVRDNQLTSLDVSQNTLLIHLYCGINQLTSIDVSNNPNLLTLYCHFNQLTSLDLSPTTALKNLSCRSNQLTSLDLSNNPNILGVECSTNPITSVNLTNCTQLWRFYGSGMDLTTIDLSISVALGDFQVEGNQLTTLDVSNNTALTILNCGNNQLTSLDVSNNTILETLTFKDNNITSIDVSTLTVLESLRCHQNQLTTLNVSNNTLLTTLTCAGNQITSLDVSNNTALTYLHIGGNTHLGTTNLITSLDVSNNTSLETLYCGFNQLTSLDVSNNTALTYLDCDGGSIITAYNPTVPLGQLTTLDVSNNTALITLNCSNNQLTSLDLTNGNNANMTYALPGGVTGMGPVTFGNTGLTTINVDNASWSTANWPLASGDTNWNGYVGWGDEHLTLAFMGQVVTPWTHGDANGDGYVGADDLAIVIANQGTWPGLIDAWTSFN